MFFQSRIYSNVMAAWSIYLVSAEIRCFFINIFILLSTQYIFINWNVKWFFTKILIVVSTQMLCIFSFFYISSIFAYIHTLNQNFNKLRATIWPFSYAIQALAKRSPINKEVPIFDSYCVLFFNAIPAT